MSKSYKFNREKDKFSLETIESNDIIDESILNNTIPKNSMNCRYDEKSGKLFLPAEELDDWE